MPNLIISYISHLRKRRAPQKDLARTTHHTTTIATMARLGDKILTATATIITAGYIFFATQTPPPTTRHTQPSPSYFCLLSGTGDPAPNSAPQDLSRSSAPGQQSGAMHYQKTWESPRGQS